MRLASWPRRWPGTANSASPSNGCSPITDPCYKANSFARSCGQLGLKHRRTRPYTPRTNGKAERFIQTAINEWAYARTFQNSEERTASLPAWTHQYTGTALTPSLNQLPPISRAGLDDNNLLTRHLENQVNVQISADILTFRLKWTQIEGLVSHNNAISLQINNSVAPRTSDLLPSKKEVEVLDPSRNFFYLLIFWWS